MPQVHFFRQCRVAPNKSIEQARFLFSRRAFYRILWGEKIFEVFADSGCGQMYIFCEIVEANCLTRAGIIPIYTVFYKRTFAFGCEAWLTR